MAAYAPAQDHQEIVVIGVQSLHNRADPGADLKRIPLSQMPVEPEYRSEPVDLPIYLNMFDETLGN